MLFRAPILLVLVLLASAFAFGQDQVGALGSSSPSEAEPLRKVWQAVDAVLKAPEATVVESGHQLLDRLKELRDMRLNPLAIQVSARIRVRTLEILMVDPRVAIDPAARILQPNIAVRALWLVQALGGLEEIKDHSSALLWQPSRRWFASLMLQAMQVSEGPLAPSTIQIVGALLERYPQEFYASPTDTRDRARIKAAQIFWSLRTSDPSPEALDHPNKNEIWRSRLTIGESAAGLGEMLIEAAQTLADTQKDWDGFVPSYEERVEALTDLVAVATQFLDQDDPQRLDLVVSALRSFCRLGVRANTQRAFESLVALATKEIQAVYSDVRQLLAISQDGLRDLLREARSLLSVPGGVALLSQIGRLMFQQDPRIEQLPARVAALGESLKTSGFPSEDECREYRALLEFAMKDHQSSQFALMVRGLVDLFELSVKWPAFAQNNGDLKVLITGYSNDRRVPADLRLRMSEGLVELDRVQSASSVPLPTDDCIGPFGI